MFVPDDCSYCEAAHGKVFVTLIKARQAVDWGYLTDGSRFFGFEATAPRFAGQSAPMERDD